MRAATPDVKNDVVAAFHKKAFETSAKSYIPSIYHPKFEIEGKLYPYKYKGESKHPGFVDCNVLYMQKKASKAAAIRKRE